MTHYLTTGAHLDGELHNLMRGLALTVDSMPPGDYRNGYAAALAVVATALGVDSTPVPSGVPVPVGRQATPPCGCGQSHETPIVIDVTPRRRNDPEPPQRSSPVTVNHVFDDLSHTSVPFAFAAFANMGR